MIQTFNEEGNTLTQMGNAMKNLIQRKSLQNKSQSKKPYNELKDKINSQNHTPTNKRLNYINVKNINNNNIIKNLNILTKKYNGNIKELYI